MMRSNNLTKAALAGFSLALALGGCSQQDLHQSPTACDAGAYDGGVVFMELTPNVDVTLRASAPGYRPQERTVIPSPGSPTAILFVPSRLE